MRFCKGRIHAAETESGLCRLKLSAGFREGTGLCRLKAALRLF